LLIKKREVYPPILSNIISGDASLSSNPNALVKEHEALDVFGGENISNQETFMEIFHRCFSHRPGHDG
jgi:hypothetical protein